MKKIITILTIFFLFLTITGCKNTHKEANAHKEATFYISSYPEGAEVYINGKFEGLTTLMITLPYGKYELEAKKKNYETKKMTLAVNEKTKGINIALSEKKARNSYNVTLNVQNSEFLESPYTVYLDGTFTGKVTKCSLKNIPRGTHTIKLISLEDILEKKINLTDDITLSRNDFHNVFTHKYYSRLSYMMDVEDYSGRYIHEMKWIVFNDDKPLVDVCCSAAGTAYSGIFVNETLNIRGYIEKEAPIDSFNIIFPSGKKVHFNTVEKNGYRVFSKKVTFDELGKYTIDGGSPFYVFYKATPLPPTKTLEELFGTGGNTVAIPENTEETVRLFITDANGKPVINEPIGKYGAKTDSHSIVTLKVKGECGFSGLTVNGKNVGVRLYGGLLGWVYHINTLSKKDTDIKYINGDVYIPKNQVRGYFSDTSIRDTKTINGKEYADLDTLREERGLRCSVMITDDKIEFLKMCDMVP